MDGEALCQQIAGLQPGLFAVGDDFARVADAEMACLIAEAAFVRIGRRCLFEGVDEVDPQHFRLGPVEFGHEAIAIVGGMCDVSRVRNGLQWGCRREGGAEQSNYGEEQGYFRRGVHIGEIYTTGRKLREQREKNAVLSARS